MQKRICRWENPENYVLFSFLLGIESKIIKIYRFENWSKRILGCKNKDFCIVLDAFCLELMTKFREKGALKKVPSRILAWGNCQNPHIFDYDKNGIIHSHSQDLRFSSSARPRSKRLRRVLLLFKSDNAICGLRWEGGGTKMWKLQNFQKFVQPFFRYSHKNADFEPFKRTCVQIFQDLVFTGFWDSSKQSFECFHEVDSWPYSELIYRPQ